VRTQGGWRVSGVTNLNIAPAPVEVPAASTTTTVAPAGG
jgi:hypothetical protein